MPCAYRPTFAQQILNSLNTQMLLAIIANITGTQALMEERILIGRLTEIKEIEMLTANAEILQYSKKVCCRGHHPTPYCIQCQLY